ncbi:hypothetical protein O6H91_07G033200 [Diphasiastrum complanatum]|uniref:Uncharacterized protein n=1 Tax=Diphasiastrum complanatum TaxID=34168 RepID=A0ACC2D3X1_DIPCM|nr:hypothetical protein O6H91_07G033200 [Diphasiastrum complanatum]
MQKGFSKPFCQSPPLADVSPPFPPIHPQPNACATQPLLQPLPHLAAPTAMPPPSPLLPLLPQLSYPPFLPCISPPSTAVLATPSIMTIISSIPLASSASATRDTVSIPPISINPQDSQLFPRYLGPYEPHQFHTTHLPQYLDTTLHFLMPDVVPSFEQPISPPIHTSAIIPHCSFHSKCRV